MDRHSLRDAQDHLQQLIFNAQHGKMVVILDDNDQGVQLVPVSVMQTTHRTGSARGLVKFAADFDEPLADFNEYME